MAAPAFFFRITDVYVSGSSSYRFVFRTFALDQEE